ncbi:hypothetical protein ACG2OD_18405 [Streptomyces sp. PDY-4]|uniref:hypothetical protein n=1 Tax=Streptomyces sp. PDY-4 TaxID=3376070 RepID=UPI003788CDCF
MFRRASVVAAVVLALAAGGCGSGGRAPGREPAEGAAFPAPGIAGPLPEAADGGDTGACADGECEVLVTSTADITANGMDVHVTVRDDYVAFRTAGTLMQLGGGAGGRARFGDGLTATVVAHDEDDAVLRFTTP